MLQLLLASGRAERPPDERERLCGAIGVAGTAVVGEGCRGTSTSGVEVPEHQQVGRELTIGVGGRVAVAVAELLDGAGGQTVGQLVFGAVAVRTRSGECGHGSLEVGCDQRLELVECGHGVVEQGVIPVRDRQDQTARDSQFAVSIVVGEPDGLPSQFCGHAIGVLSPPTLGETEPDDDLGAAVLLGESGLQELGQPLHRIGQPVAEGGPCHLDGRSHDVGIVHQRKRGVPHAFSLSPLAGVW